MKQRNSDRLKLTLAMVIFGTIGIVRRYIPYPSSVIALVRAAVGVLFLLLVHWIRRERFDRAGMRKNLVPLLISGVLLGFNWICLFEAYRYTSVAVATICYYMAPVIVMLVSPVVFHEGLTLKKGVCCMAALGGMVLVSGVPESGVSGFPGVGLGLLAAVMYAAIVLLNKAICGISPGERTAYQLGIAAVSMLPYVLLTEKLTALEFSPVILAMLAVAGIVHTGIAYVLYFGSLATIPAQTAAMLSYLDPIVAVILSVALLRESLTVLSGVGILIVLGATIISEFGAERKTQ